MIGFIIAIIVLIFSISVAPIIIKTLDYLGNMVTPLSLVYIGIVLRDTGLSSIRLNKDTIGGLFGRFIITPMGMKGDDDNKQYVIPLAPHTTHWSPSLCI